jgi:tRNA dimethylallyltransferase
MIEKGLVEEVEKLIEKYKKFPTAMQGLGYKEVRDYLEEKLSYEDMIEKIKQESRRYAKRQLTWFRKDKDTIWIDGLNDMEENISIILEAVNIE